MTQYLRYLPNVITIGRMLAVLPLMWLMWHEAYAGALLIAVIAGISDGLDGYLAKKFNWQGWLGGVLDPLADKFMMLACYTVFWLQEIVPWWLYVLIIGRDVVIVLGATYYHFRIGKIAKATPTLISKVNTVLQILLLWVLLISYSGLVDMFDAHWPIIWLVAVTSVISGVHYVLMGFKMKARQQLDETGGQHAKHNQ
jgi:cardiolipin synthase